MKGISEVEWKKLVKERKKAWKNRRKPKLFCRHRWTNVDEFQTKEGKIIRRTINKEVNFSQGQKTMYHECGFYGTGAMDKCVKCGGYQSYSTYDP